MILEGYGFSFFGNKGYTFSPIFARDNIVVQFQGHFVEEIPDDKFTVVLKKVKGEDAVPLFQTLTFHIDIVHPTQEGHVGHMLALYEMGEQMFDSVAESAYAIYAVSSLVCITLLYAIAKFIMNRREAAKSELASIEAFSYDEKASNIVQNSEEDTENSSKQSYHNLSAGRPTTPAVF